MKTLREHSFFAVFFGALFIYFLWPLILLKSSFVLGDYGIQFFPWSYLYSESLKAGRLPYWTNLIANGFPLVAEGQVGAYYLLHLASYLLLPFKVAYTWGILFHFLLGGIGFYRYCQKIGQGKEAAVLSAVLFSFSSAYGGCFYTTGTLRVLSWLPWCLIALETLRDARTGRSAVIWVSALAFFISQMWTAGFPQLAVYAIGYMALGIFLVSGERPRLIMYFVLANLVAILLALPQLVATLELVGVSVRAGESVDFALWGSVPPFSLIGLAFPSWGNFFRVSFYIGILPLLFVLVSLATKKDKKERAHLVLVLFFIFLALGKYNPLYTYFVKTLSLNAFRNPSKFLFFSTVSLAALAGFGIQKILDLKEDKPRPKNLKNVILFSVVGIGSAPFIASRALRLTKNYWVDYGHALAKRIFMEKSDPVRTVQEYDRIIQDMLSGLGSVLSPLNIWNIVATLLLILSAIFLIRYFPNERSKRGFKYGVAILVFVDLALFGRFFGTGFMGNAAPMDPQKNEKLVQQIQALRGDTQGVIAEVASNRENELMEPSANIFYGLPHAGGYSPLLIKRYYELTKELGLVDSSLGRQSFQEEVWRKERGLIDVLGIDTVISDEKLSIPGFNLAGVLHQRSAESMERYSYKNDRALPSLTVVHEWVEIQAKNERLDYLKSAKFNPRLKAVVEEAELGFKPSPGRSYFASADISMDSQSMRGHVRLETDGLAVFRSAYYPVMKAKVDGVLRKVVPVNHALSGVYLESGEHQVEFYYDKSKNHRWEWASLACWIVLGFGNLIVLRKRNFT